MVLGVIGSVLPLGGTGWYFVVLGQYNLVLLFIKWYWVSFGILCLYIFQKVEIWSGVTTRATKKIGSVLQ